MSTTESVKKCPVAEWEFAPKPRPAMSGFHQADGFDPDKIMWVDEFQGYYMVTGQKTITEILKDTDTFSSSAVLPYDPDPEYKWVPLMHDGEAHLRWRKLLQPYFSPTRAREATPAMREGCAALIDKIATSGGTEFMESFAKVFPIAVFMDFFGLPVEDREQVLDWENTIMHPDAESDPDLSKFKAAVGEVFAYFGRLIEQRRANPEAAPEGLLTEALTWEMEGKPVDGDELLNFCVFMFIAGLDTVTSQLGWTFHHLATHPEDRKKLVENPSLIPNAVEEMLRAFTFIATARKAKVDTEINGCPVSAGELVYIPLAAASRDAAVYEGADQVDIERAVNRHAAFGIGVHRCLGAHLAREELAVAIEEWHKRIPNYSIAPDAEITEHMAGAWSIDSLPLVWDN